MNSAARQQGAVLMSAVVMLLMLTLMVASSLRTSSLAIAQAATQRAAQQAFHAAEQDLRDAQSAASFERHTTATPVARRTDDDISTDTSLRYLGEATALPHPDYDPALHAHLRAHFFEATVVVIGTRGIGSRHQQLFYVIADAATPPGAALDSADPRVVSAFNAAVFPLSWRFTRQ